MAIFMATTKSISRSNGQSAVASASYRAGERLQDERYGKTQDYSKRHGVMSATIILPSQLKDKTAIDRHSLWNMAEKAEKRKDSRVAREWIVNLPHELDEQTRKTLAHDFAQSLSDKYGVIADCCIHRPTEKEIRRGADPRNFHAHILLTTRQAELSQNGKITLGEKATIELSDTKRRSLGLERVSQEIIELRQLWEQIANRYLRERGIDLIDSRSYEARELGLMPQIKMGKQATHMERDGIRTEKGDVNRLIRQYNEAYYELAITSSQHRVAETKRVIAEAERTATANTKNSERRVEQCQAMGASITENAKRLEASQQRVTYTKSLITQITTATDRNTERTTQAQQRINDTQPKIAGTDRFIDQSKQRLIATYTAVINNPRTIDRVDRQTEHTDHCLERTKSTIIDCYRTIETAYQQLNKHHARIMQSEAHRKALATQKRENDRKVAEQSKIAEKARQEEIEGYAERQTYVRRHAFENTFLPHVQQHLASIQKAKVEFDYPLERYSLYRATKAITQLHTAVEKIDPDGVMAAFNDYQLAIKGDGVMRHDRETNHLAREGNLGLIEKFRQRDLYGYVHYEWNKPNQLELKLQAIAIAKHCQDYVKKVIDFAVDQQVVDNTQAKRMGDVLSQLDRSLSHHEKEAMGYLLRFTQSHDRQNAFSR